MDRRRAMTTIALIGPWLLAMTVACGDDSPTGEVPEAAAEGREVAQRSGCTACHGASGEGGIGPAWVGGLGTEIELEDGTTVTVDEAYLTRAIAEPGAQVHAGYAYPMPQNQLSDTEIAQLVAYIVELNGGSSDEVAG
jgi:cytochrome c oxidase subunit II